MENILNNVEYVGIDLDDTLYDRDFVYENTFFIMEKEVLRSNIDFLEFNKVFQYYSLIEFNKFNRKEKDNLSYKLDRVKTTYKKLGRNINDEQVVIFHSLYEFYRNNIQLRPKALDFIHLIYELDLQPFILTNGPSMDQRNKIRSLKLEKVIKDDMIFISDEIGYAKPDKRVFNYIEKKLSTNGENIIYIGDHLDYDILASKKNNWNPIYFDFNQTNSAPTNIITVNNFSTIIDLFMKFKG